MTDDNHARRTAPPGLEAREGSDSAPDTVVSEGESLQAAIDSAGPGTVIGVEAGTFTEQVVLDSPVTLRGAGPGTTTVRSPRTLSAAFTAEGTDIRPVVAVTSDGAAVRNLTVDGNGQGRGNGSFVGVGSHDASVAVSDVEVTGVTEEPVTDARHGFGVFVRNDDGRDRSVHLERCEVHGYQKDGIVGEGEGLDLHVTGCLVTGDGVTERVAQNGVLARNVSRATVVGNTVTDHSYAGSGFAAGIVLYRTPDALVARNVVEANDVGVGAEIAGRVVARRNNIRANGTGALDRGSTAFDATNNWWGSADGPSASDMPGGEEDAETGTVADGNGDAVYDVHWEPYSTTPFQLRSNGSGSRADADERPKRQGENA